MQYAPTLTDQKFDSTLYDESQTWYVLGRMQYTLPIRVKNLIPLCTMNLKPGTCWGVRNTPLPIRIKNLIPIYWVYLKLGRFFGVCLCGQPHLSGKPLKFV